MGYFSYKAKSCCNSSENKPCKPWLLKLSKGNMLFIAILSICFSIMVTNYYTGQTPFSIIDNISNNISLYYEYQTYFRDQQRGAFSLTKLPFIFMAFYIKLLLFYSYITLFIFKSKLNKFDIIYLFLISIAHIYFGIARGTNFEYFELTVLIIFIILIKYSGKYKFSIKLLLKVGILISCMIFLFYSIIKERGVSLNYYISRDVFFDQKGIVSTILPFLSFIVIMIYSYFGFGFYYISSYINYIWFESGTNIFLGLLPFGFKSINNNSLKYLMNNIVDMGARWHPDIIFIIERFGYLGLLLFCFFLGMFAKCKDKSPIVYLTNFMIFLQMISLPVGNFISTSSSNKLIVMTLIFYWIWKKMVKVKIKL